VKNTKVSLSCLKHPSNNYVNNGVAANFEIFTYTDRDDVNGTEVSTEQPKAYQSVSPHEAGILKMTKSKIQPSLFAPPPITPAALASTWKRSQNYQHSAEYQALLPQHYAINGGADYSEKPKHNKPKVKDAVHLELGLFRTHYTQMHIMLWVRKSR
jgi:hypothetical protein